MNECPEVDRPKTLLGKIAFWAMVVAVCAFAFYFSLYPAGN